MSNLDITYSGIAVGILAAMMFLGLVFLVVLIYLPFELLVQLMETCKSTFKDTASRHVA
jgi:hypothetical protein